jgi:hypothetical protein
LATRTSLASHSPAANVLKLNLSGTEYNLASGNFVEFDIVTYPVVVVFPMIVGYTIEVYDNNHDIIGRFTEWDNAVAVYFSTAASMGTIVVSSVIETEFEYFAITWPGWNCSEFVVSTSQLETFTGSSSVEDHANITLGNYQNVCLFELSSSEIAISANYSTEARFDFLCFSSPSDTAKYSGNGTFDDSLAYFAGVWWHSDNTDVSTSFSIRFVSSGSTLPILRWRYHVTSDSPLVLENEIIYPTLTQRHTATEVTIRRDSGSSTLTLGLAIGVPLFAVVIVLGIVICRLRRKPKPQVGQPQLHARNWGHFCD